MPENCILTGKKLECRSHKKSQYLSHWGYSVLLLTVFVAWLLSSGGQLFRGQGEKVFDFPRARTHPLHQVKSRFFVDFSCPPQINCSLHAAVFPLSEKSGDIEEIPTPFSPQFSPALSTLFPGESFWLRVDNLGTFLGKEVSRHVQRKMYFSSLFPGNELQIAP